MNNTFPILFEKKDLRNYYGFRKNATLKKHIFTPEILDQIGMTEAEYKAVIRYFPPQICQKIREVLVLPGPYPEQSYPKLVPSPPKLYKP